MTSQGSGGKGHDLLRAIAGFTQANQDPKVETRRIRLGQVDYDYNPADFLGGVNPKVLFEGESTLSQKRYPVMAGYYPLPGARVVLLPVGTTYMIVGTVDTKPAGSPGRGVLDGGCRDLDQARWRTSDPHSVSGRRWRWGWGWGHGCWRLFCRCWWRGWSVRRSTRVSQHPSRLCAGHSGRGRGGRCRCRYGVNGRNVLLR